MEENIEEENVNKSLETESENSQNDITPIQDLETSNSTKETENMEVHHHAHQEGKKNWKSYFWEFFMLFLAVFCGFLAEYQLEHKIETDREAVYIKNLLEDLNSDLVSFADYNTRVEKCKGAIDSLFIMFKSPNRNKNLSEIYFLARIITLQPYNLIPNVRTYEQMKNSGHLRLIKKQNTATEVSKYYLDMQGILEQNNLIREKLNMYHIEMGELFEAEILWQIFNTRKSPSNKNLKLLSEDPITISRYLTATQYYIATQIRQNDRVNEASKKSKELIELIKKEYKLD